KLCTGRLVVGSVRSKVVFNHSIQSLTLAVRLRMMSRGKTPFDDFDLARLTPELRRDTRISVGDDAAWRAKAAFDMLEEELGEVGGRGVVTGRDKKGIFRDTAHNCEDAVEFLAVLHRQRQSCDPIKADFLEGRIPGVCG